MLKQMYDHSMLERSSTSILRFLSAITQSDLGGHHLQRAREAAIESAGIMASIQYVPSGGLETGV